MQSPPPRHSLLPSKPQRSRLQAQWSLERLTLCKHLPLSWRHIHFTKKLGWRELLYACFPQGKEGIVNKRKNTKMNIIYRVEYTFTHLKGFYCQFIPRPLSFHNQSSWGTPRVLPLLLSLVSNAILVCEHTKMSKT